MLICHKYGEKEGGENKILKEITNHHKGQFGDNKSLTIKLNTRELYTSYHSKARKAGCLQIECKNSHLNHTKAKVASTRASYKQIPVKAHSTLSIVFRNVQLQCWCRRIDAKKTQDEPFTLGRKSLFTVSEVLRMS